MPVTLVIGNKAYSSWSLRPWLLLAAFAIPFEEKVIPLYEDASKRRIRRLSPSGKVPALIDGDVEVWESLAILEYIAERFPAKAIWPKSRPARARARSLCAEMHAGFTALRSQCPTNFRRPVARRELNEAALADVTRIETAWADARKRHGRGGPFLFGKFCAADAMFAPVVNRLHIYDVKVKRETRAYMDAVMALPAYQAWLKDASAEPWRIEAFEL